MAGASSTDLLALAIPIDGAPFVHVSAEAVASLSIAADGAPVYVRGQDEDEPPPPVAAGIVCCVVVTC